MTRRRRRSPEDVEMVRPITNVLEKYLGRVEMYPQITERVLRVVLEIPLKTEAPPVRLDMTYWDTWAVERVAEIVDKTLAIIARHTSNHWSKAEIYLTHDRAKAGGEGRMILSLSTEPQIHGPSYGEEPRTMLHIYFKSLGLERMVERLEETRQTLKTLQSVLGEKPSLISVDEKRIEISFIGEGFRELNIYHLSPKSLPQILGETRLDRVLRALYQNLSRVDISILEVLPNAGLPFRHIALLKLYGSSEGLAKIQGILEELRRSSSGETGISVEAEAIDEEPQDGSGAGVPQTQG